MTTCESDTSIQRARSAATIPTPDPEHSLHVACLSLQLFDQAREVLGLSAEQRDLLAAAALWHDVGQRRSMPNHHKESFDLILAEPHRDFDQTEWLQIANIARYHRQANPSVEHPGYRQLSRQERAVVDRLGAILRVAEALDASHLQIIDHVDVRVGPDRAVFALHADIYPTMEIERGQARSGLFRSAFHRDTTFTWARRNRAPGAVS